MFIAVYELLVAVVFAVTHEQNATSSPMHKSLVESDKLSITD